MEILELSGYTDEEKLAIAHRFLIPKQVKAHGLANEPLEWTDEGLTFLIRNYTREAGVGTSNERSPQWRGRLPPERPNIGSSVS